MKTFTVIYEKQDTTTGYWSCVADTLDDCKKQFNASGKSWKHQAIDFVSVENKKECQH